MRRLDVLRVLIIDDNQMDRELASEVLTQIHLEDVDRFEVKEAAFGREGVKLAIEQDFDVILLDYNLPDINGLKVMEKLLEANNGTPVIAMTSAGGEEVARKFMAAGARDYVTKDQLSDVRLATTIRNVVWVTKLGRGMRSSTGSKAWKKAKAG